MSTRRARRTSRAQEARARPHPKTGPTKPTFGQNLRRARHAAGITQSDLAYEARVDRSAVSMYEQDHREPNLRTIRKLARVLEVGASELVRGL